MSCDHELANEKTRCSGKNASYITIQFSSKQNLLCTRISTIPDLSSRVMTDRLFIELTCLVPYMNSDCRPDAVDPNVPEVRSRYSRLQGPRSFGQQQESRTLAWSDFFNMRRLFVSYYQPIRFVQFDGKSCEFFADFECWTGQEDAIFFVLTKRSAASGDNEWGGDCVFSLL